jgi:hypothetical protein
VITRDAGPSPYFVRTVSISRHAARKNRSEPSAKLVFRSRFPFWKTSAGTSGVIVWAQGPALGELDVAASVLVGLGEATFPAADGEAVTIEAIGVGS